MEPEVTVAGMTFESRPNDDGTVTWVYQVPEGDAHDVMEAAQMGVLGDLASLEVGGLPIGIGIIGGAEGLVGADVALGLSQTLVDAIPGGNGNGNGFALTTNQATAIIDLGLAIFANSRLNRSWVGKPSADFATLFLLVDSARNISPIDQWISDGLKAIGIGNGAASERGRFRRTPRGGNPRSSQDDRRNPQHAQTPDIVAGRVALLGV